MVGETRRAAQALGVELQVLEARDPLEFAKVFGAMGAAKAHAVVVLPDPMFVAQRERIAELAARTRIPAMYHLRQFVAGGRAYLLRGGLCGSVEQSAVLIDKILKGAKPADLPVEQPWRFDLAINLKTTKALGLTIPPSLLGRADQVIE